MIEFVYSDLVSSYFLGSLHILAILSQSSVTVSSCFEVSMPIYLARGFGVRCSLMMVGSALFELLVSFDIGKSIHCIEIPHNSTPWVVG